MASENDSPNTTSSTGVDRRPADANALENKYSVDMHIFPPSLAWLKENENYVAFYINVPSKTSATLGSDQTIGDVAPIGFGTYSGRTAAESGLFTSETTYKRLKTAIVLPIMERPTAKYSADWDMVALGPVLGWAMTHGGSENSIDLTSKAGWEKAGAGNMAMDAVRAFGLSTINNAAGLVGMGGDASAKDIFGILQRTAINEHRTQIFKSIRFRNFEFSYRFSPRDAAQANTIKNIIQTFKFHMHPDTAESNLFLTYPSEFDIVFYFQEKENTGPEPAQQNLFKISTCAMTDFQVDYGGDKFFTFGDGMPTEINMHMSFMELELLTKARIKEGF
jgi:hypothetical protein